MTTSVDVLVLGGGLVGLAAARALAKAGYSVTLLEQSVPGAGASHAAAGMLAPLGDVGRALGPVARAARDGWFLWREAIERESLVTIEMGNDGALLVALDDADEAGLDHAVRQAEELGEVAEPVDRGTILERVPDLAPEVRRGLHLPGERRVDNVAMVGALTRASTLAGVRIRADFAAQRIEYGATGVRVVDRQGQFADADWLVLAAGVGSAELRGLPALPVRPVRGQMLRLEGVRWPWDGIVRRPVNYAVRRGTESLLVGATVEPDAGFDSMTTLEGLGYLLDWTRATFPTLAAHSLSSVWAGLRPGSPDHLPLLGPLPTAPRVIAATGHYRNGILLAPWTADVIVDTVRTGALPERAGAFDVARHVLPS